MPVKLNWKKGQTFGLALIYLGVMLFIQVFFIFIGQYSMQIGDTPVIILIPIGVSIATFYSVIVLFESSTSMADYRKSHAYTTNKSKKAETFKEKTIEFLSNLYVKPVASVLVVFTITFMIVWLLLFAFVSASFVFLLSDNIAALAVIIFANMQENQAKRRTR